jgi:galactokinase
MCFLLANTRVKHNLVESEYNERRAACEQAAEYFASCLPNPVKALRDVSQAEFQKHSGGLDPVIARRAEHIIRENERVLEARKMLLAGRTKEFGKLMYASHESSRLLFENSCPELDFIVDALCRMPETIGARLSGGGFGGSVVIAALPEDAGQISTVITCAYEKRFGHPCAMRAIKPSAGARLINVKRTS